MTRREINELCMEDIVMLMNKNKKKGSTTNQIPCRVIHVSGLMALIEPLEGYEWTGTHSSYEHLSRRVGIQPEPNWRWYHGKELKLIEKKAYKVKVRKIVKGVH